MKQMLCLTPLLFFSISMASDYKQRELNKKVSRVVYYSGQNYSDLPELIKKDVLRPEREYEQRIANYDKDKGRPVAFLQKGPLQALTDLDVDHQRPRGYDISRPLRWLINCRKSEDCVIFDACAITSAFSLMPVLSNMPNYMCSKLFEEYSSDLLACKVLGYTTICFIVLGTMVGIAKTLIWLDKWAAHPRRWRRYIHT